jgi:hypothetical protein
MLAMVAESYRRTGSSLSAPRAKRSTRMQKRREVRALLDEIAMGDAPPLAGIDLPAGLKEVLDLWLETRLTH